MVEFNLAAQENFRINKDQLGMPIEIAMADWTDIVDFATTHSQDTAQSIIAQAGTARVFDVHLTSLKDQRGRTFGKVIVFRDATERHQTEQVLEQRLKEIQELHENLKTSQAELVEQQRMLAKMEERQRMGRDLHDSVSQSIHSLVLFTETLAATLDKNNIKRARQIAGRVQESARQAHKETRLLLYGLQDTGTDRIVNLIEALEDRLTNVERHTGVKVNFIQEGVQQDLPQEWLENLFWIATEALNNALKYAQAHIIQILMDWQETGFEMEIRDDGIGFDSTMMQTGGLGMHTMRERANLLGGELHIISSPGNGTRVCFRSKKEK
jgi:signal transduction histidine kinase